MRHFPKEKSLLRFLSLRYSADFRRSRLVVRDSHSILWSEEEEKRSEYLIGWLTVVYLVGLVLNLGFEQISCVPAEGVAAAIHEDVLPP